MLASCSLAIGDTVLCEGPVLTGTCSVSCIRCRGISGCTPLSGCRKDCMQAEADPGLRAAIAWHHSTSARVLCHMTGAEQVNGIRVCCLMALVIQAAGNAPLREWLLSYLRPADVSSDGSDPHAASTLGFARLFARVVPLEVPELHSLLLVLQTNLFTIDHHSIAIYAAACLLEHSCRPNAQVTLAQQSAALSVRATRPIAAGEPLSFAYLDEAWLTTAPVAQRRQRMRDELGFLCRCVTCVDEEGARG